MKLTDFDFDLPDERIARFPAEKRENSRLMVVDRDTGNISHHYFSDITELLEPDDFFVMNNTEVIPARLFGSVGNGKAEILIIKKTEEQSVEVFAMPARKLDVGNTIFFKNGIEAVVTGRGERGIRALRFNCELEKVYEIGFAPLPPYIKRKKNEADKYRDFDLKRYQTLFSKNPGSIAAPTAGLHFSKDLLNSISKDHEMLEITLSVGPATFQKIEVDNIRDHKMGSESIKIENNISGKIKFKKKAGKKLVAVGTTSVRSLETFARLSEEKESFESELFIYPGFEFKMIDKMITNFHLPKSSLFILVSAFAGINLIKEAYEEAIKEKYNFFSYGDAMFIK
ncbi:MAG: tRNA preQ1(34) S-adenosylmethionine ribosyltransferase-isomerase QueA [Acidobacteriota bacterium]